MSVEAATVAPGGGLTQEQARIVYENRLRARARLRRQALSQRARIRSRSAASASATGDAAQGSGPGAAATPSIGPNANLATVPSTSRNAQLQPGKMRIVGSKTNIARRPTDDTAPLQRDKALGNYIEFDLSKLHNSKGGFLIDQDDEASSGKSLEELRKEKQRELQRNKPYLEPGISLDKETRPTCEVCGSPEILEVPFRKVFGIQVCKRCEREHPERYSLLTKTEVKQDYLLTDAELRDEELLPHLLKANPHKATYSNMMLFCRKQVEAFAFSDAKWGSEENLDAEFERREEEKARKRGLKFQQRLADLRKRTRDNVWQKRKDEEHVHQWEEVEVRGHTKQRCVDCQYEIDVEVF
ncbi:DNA repair protein rad14 [Thecaphora frezii]